MDPGTYYIVNAQLAPHGAELASNYVANNAPLNVIEDMEFPPQQWNVIGPQGMPQTISPVLNPDFETRPGGDFVEALPAADFTWNITNVGGAFCIGKPGMVNVWAIDMAAAGQQIVLVPMGDLVPPLQRWNFLPAPLA